MDRQLRIGYLMQNGAPDLDTTSGPQLHVTAVINGLRRRGHRVRTVAFQRGRLQWTDDLEEWHPASYGATKAAPARLFESAARRIQSELHLPFLNLFDSIHYADASIRLLDGVDIMYERHGYLGYGGLLAARWMGVPLVVEMNGNILKEIDEMGVEMSRVQRAIGRQITKRSLRAADQVVAVSSALKDQVVRELGVAEGRVAVVVNGVNLDLFSRPVEGSQVRRRYGVGPGPLVVFVGSFQPWHGVESLVCAFQTVLRHFPNAYLLLAGDGPGRHALDTQVHDLGLAQHTVLTGRLPQKDVAEIVHAADVVAAPYGLQHADVVGTPLKIVEYMAAGKAIVATTAPIHELVTDGVTGVRVAPASAEALAEGVLRLLADDALRERLGNAARLEAQRYSWDGVVASLCALFDRQLSKRST